MGWDDVAPSAKDMMSKAQREMIISLREQHDGARPGSYSSDHLPEWTKWQASHEIEKLQAKLKQRKVQLGKPPLPPKCMACFAGVTHPVNPKFPTCKGRP